MRQPDLRRYWVPISAFLWTACMALAGVVTRIMDITSLVTFPLGTFVVLALPGFVVGAAWFVVRLFRP
jgi:hypothetical protein